MKKYFKKVLKFIKEKKLIFIIAASVLLVVGAIYFIFFRTKVDTIKSVKKVLAPNNYNVACLDSNCDYIVASNGNEFGKHTILVYNSKGKRIAKINDNYDSESSITKKVSGATNNYVILSKTDYNENKTVGYELTDTKGKAKYSSDNILYSLTDDLVAELSDNNYKIINTSGKTVFKSVVNVERYANNSVLSLTLKNENIITDSKGNSKLSGYSIVKEVNDDKGNTLYFIVEDTNKNGYYYYNYKSNKIVGDQFYGYSSGEKEGELIITKKNNGLSTKYVLTKDGKQEEYVSENLGEFIDTIKNSVNTEEYSVYSNSIKSKSQKVILVNKKKDNTLGVYDISSKKYTKLLDYKKEYGSIVQTELEAGEKELYLQINCSTNYCEKNVSIVYDMVKNKELYRYESEENIPQGFIGYEGDYKVIKYSLNSSEDYKGKYVLYDKNNKEITKSENRIIVVDKKKLFGNETNAPSYLLFSGKQNKMLNNDKNLASKVSVGSTYVYKYSDGNNTYLLNEKGKVLRTIAGNSVSLIYSEDAVIYIDKDKVNIINPVDNKSKSYKLKKNEKINDNSGLNITPYKNSIFINNTVDGYGKVINVNGRTVKKIKNASINSVNYNKKTDTVIIITKRIKGNGNQYGLYIAK